MRDWLFFWTNLIVALNLQKTIRRTGQGPTEFKRVEISCKEHANTRGHFAETFEYAVQPT